MTVGARTKPYVYDFQPDTPLEAAIRTIVSSLADDGLALTDNDNAVASRINSYLMDDSWCGHRVKRVVVPAHRVVRRVGPLTVMK